MAVKEQIIDSLKKALAELGVTGVEVKLEVPQDPAHGDFSTNVALLVAKKLSRNPLELAENIVGILNTKYQIPNTDRVEAIKPGFINFYLSQEFLVESLALQGEALQNKTLEGQKVMVEFTDPNPFKEFHIGHLYSNAVGESISRLLEHKGAEVRRVTYQGDVGLHVAKCLWGMMHGVVTLSGAKSLGNQDPSATPQDDIEKLEKKPLKERINILGQAYASGSKAYEEDQEATSNAAGAQKEIHEINKKIYEVVIPSEGFNVTLSETKSLGNQDPSPAKRVQDDKEKRTQEDIEILYQKGRAWSLEYFDSIYKRLGSKFVKNYFESTAGPVGLKLVKEHLKDKVFKESDGAIIFEGKNYGLHNRVFVNSLGLPTYEAKDMGLPGQKYKDFPYDQSIIITANEQSEYFTVVLKVLSLISPDLAAKTRHIGHGMIRLPEGKMSSRTGNVITGEWLLDEAKRRIAGEYADMDEETLEMVAVAAVKYSLLKVGIGKDVEFSFAESISLAGNSGPYLQYTYVRTQSVLAKTGYCHSEQSEESWNPDPSPASGIRMTKGAEAKLEAEELVLLRLLFQFEDVVTSAAFTLNPATLCNYLFGLAHQYNLFYTRHSIIGSANENFRLALNFGVGKTLKTGLGLLGIPTPTKM